MERVKFFAENSNEKEFARTLRKRVQDYFTENKITIYGNARMYFKSIVMVGLYMTPFVIILTVPLSPLAAVGMAVLIGIGAAGVGMSVMHDGAHGSYSSKAWLNDLAAFTMFLLGSNTLNWKIQHNVLHHTFTNMFDLDPDVSTKAIIRLNEQAPLKKYHRFQQYYSFFLYGLMTFLRFFGEFGVLLKNHRTGILKEQHADFKLELVKLIATKVMYLAIVFGLPLLLTDYTFWQVLLGFIVMQVTAGMIMSTVFQMAHVVEGTYQPLPDKNNIIHCEWVVHQLRSTSDFGRKNGLLSWYIGGLDYQVEHHLFPNICHIHYPAIAPIVEATAKAFGINYNLKPAFRHALVSHFRRLRELGRERQNQ